MAIRYYKIKREIYSHGQRSEKYVARMQKEPSVGLDKISVIIEKHSSVSKGDVLAVLTSLEYAVPLLLEEGHPVTLGILGTFYPAIEAKAVDTPEKVTNDTILRFFCIFKPSKVLKKLFGNISFVLSDNKVRGVNYKKQ